MANIQLWMRAPFTQGICGYCGQQTLIHFLVRSKDTDKDADLGGEADACNGCYGKGFRFLADKFTPQRPLAAKPSKQEARTFSSRDIGCGNGSYGSGLGTESCPSSTTPTPFDISRHDRKERAL